MGGSKGQETNRERPPHLFNTIYTPPNPSQPKSLPNQQRQFILNFQPQQRLPPLQLTYHHVCPKKEPIFQVMFVEGRGLHFDQRWLGLRGRGSDAAACVARRRAGRLFLFFFFLGLFPFSFGLVRWGSTKKPRGEAFNLVGMIYTGMLCLSRRVFAKKRRGSNMFMGSSLPPANTSESDKDVNFKKWSAVEGLGKNRNLFLWRLRGADKSRSPTSCVPSRHPSGKHLATSQRVGSMVRRLTRSQAMTKHPKVKVNSKTHVLGPFG